MAKPPKPNPSDVIAISDVHGQIGALRKFVSWVKGSGAEIICCGDMIDRAKQPGDDLKVLRLFKDMNENPEKYGIKGCVCLIGNHELLLLNTVDGYGSMDWVRNGGDYENLPKLAKYAPWLRSLPCYTERGDTFFSHSGCFPGIHPEEYMASEGLREEFVWNRGSFLKKGPQFEKWAPHLSQAVFGHTPRGSQPYEVKDAICIDTACFHTGKLTAFNVTVDEWYQFASPVPKKKGQSQN